MESNGRPGGMYSNVQQPPGMLGLEMSLHPRPHHLSTPPQQNPRPNHPVAAFGHHEADYHPQTVKQSYPFAAKPKNPSLTLSDDDEHGFTAENSADDGKKNVSPWHRMKWTDEMVRLLIVVVFYIGDEAVSSEGNDAKKKGGGALQKKGKWKSVSRSMMERGFYVSPQQCEDKFNDLNKRYKRVNDILGKGTACRVVENQSLLDSMDHLSKKMKDEVKKLLNSKHLFFREMCAYHNSCGHGSGGASGSGGVQHSPLEAMAEPPQAQLHSRQQRCLHSTGNAPVMPNLSKRENEGSKMVKGMNFEDDDDDHDEEAEYENEDDDDSDEDTDEVNGGGSRVHHRGQDDDINSVEETTPRKRAKNGALLFPLTQRFQGEVTNLLQDGTKSSFEKRQWMKLKLLGLEEQRVEIQEQAFEIEKQLVKWLKFRSKKEREMEEEKLRNELMQVENERMILVLRQKELEFINYHRQHQQQQQLSSNKKSAPSSITGRSNCAGD